MLNHLYFLSMKTSSKILTAAALVATLGVTGFGALTSFAAENPQGQKHPLVEAIATKFHLNVVDVQAVFDEERAKRQDTRQEHRADFMADHLAQAVKDGKLSQAQADALKAKQAEMQTYMENLKGKTPEERKIAMEAKRTEFETWTKAQGIPLPPQKFQGKPNFGHRPSIHQGKR